MPPKYDLIFEQDGSLKVTAIDAKSREEAKKAASCSGVKIKGIVFSDENNDPSQRNEVKNELHLGYQLTRM